jgi:hypothetical protein
MATVVVRPEEPGPANWSNNRVAANTAEYMRTHFLIASVVAGVAACAVVAADGIDTLETLSERIVTVSYKVREPADGRSARPPVGAARGHALTVDQVIVVFHRDDDHLQSR